MKEENQENQTKKENQEKKTNYWSYLFLAAILLFFCVFGITYSIYTGDDTGHEIDTGQIVFTYSDVNPGGSGILLEDASPISDALGKKMVGKNQYFDFYITATTKKAKLLYKLLINKNEQSTLSDKNIQIYLTQMMGSYEEEKVFTNFSSLKKEVINNKDYYVLYEKTLDEGLKSYNESYRLRMWLKEDSKDYEDKMFSIKVDVYAYQVEG